MVMDKNLLFEISRIKEIMKINEDENIIINELNEQELSQKHDSSLSYIDVPPSVINRVDNIIDLISTWDNKFLCGDIIEKNGVNTCRIKFKINYTDHFLKRFYRLSDYRYMKKTNINKNLPNVGIYYDKNIVNPGIKEWAYLLKKVIPKIVKKLENIKWDSTTKLSKSFIATKRDDKYHLAFTLEKNSPSYYDIVLITQIKGVDNFTTKNIKNPIKLNEKKIRW